MAQSFFQFCGLTAFNILLIFTFFAQIIRDYGEEEFAKMKDSAKSRRKHIREKLTQSILATHSMEDLTSKLFGKIRPETADLAAIWTKKLVRIGLSFL